LSVADTVSVAGPAEPLKAIDSFREENNTTRQKDLVRRHAPKD